jgi:arginyl-tRNA synthetase
MGARISSMLRRASEGGPEAPAAAEGGAGPYRSELLTGDAEWEVLKTLAAYNGAVADAASKTDPSLLAAYLYELSRSFSRFYHDCPVLNAPAADLAAARLALCRGVLRVLRDALDLICIPFLETM